MIAAREDAAPPTVGGALAAAEARLAAAGVAEARANAEVLLAHALGTTRTGLVLMARRPLEDKARAGFLASVADLPVFEELLHPEEHPDEGPAEKREVLSDRHGAAC